MLLQKYANKFNYHGKANSISAPIDDDILGLGSSNNNGAGLPDGNEEEDEDNSQTTPWELLADAILANPVTRFTDNPVYPTVHVPAIIDNTHNDG